MFRPQGHTVITKGSKTCPKCGESYTKSTQHWYRSRKRPDGCTGHCKHCQDQIKKEKYPSMRVRMLEQARLSKYGVTPEQFKEMLEKAQFKCEICKLPFSDDRQSTRPAVDHDHNTGEVRGVLCTRCNTALGLFRDSPESCATAAEYLKSRKK